MRSHTPDPAVRMVQANGLRHAILDDGAGPLVILQHGFPDTARTWDDVVPALVSAGFRVVRPYGRGITPSEAPDGDDYGSEQLGADLIALIEALGEEQAILVGHDWGASAVWAAGHLAPERIRKLVAVAIPHPAALSPTPAKIWGVRHFLTLRLPGAARRFRKGDFAAIRTLYERWSPGFPWPDEEFESAKNAYAKPGCLEAALGYYRCLGAWPFKGRVRTDTLVIGGQTDGVARESDFRASAGRVDGPCEVRMLPGGHFLHREHPKAFEDALLGALRPLAKTRSATGPGMDR